MLQAFLDSEKKQVKLEQVFNQLNIPTMQICDDRTLQILDTYEVYKNNPQDAFDYMTAIWFWCVANLNRVYRLKF